MKIDFGVINKVMIDCAKLQCDQEGFYTGYHETKLWLRFLFLLKGRMLMRLKNHEALNRTNETKSG